VDVIEQFRDNLERKHKLLQITGVILLVVFVGGLVLLARYFWFRHS
jgi:hypothetical protein